MIPLDEHFYLGDLDKGVTREIRVNAPHALLEPIDHGHFGSMQRAQHELKSDKVRNRRLHFIVADKKYKVSGMNVYAAIHTGEEYSEWRDKFWEGTHPVVELSATSTEDIQRRFELNVVAAADERSADGTATVEMSLIGQSFYPRLVRDVWEPVAGMLNSTTPRPLWLLASGMGSELPALADMGVRPNAIYCIEIRCARARRAFAITTAVRHATSLLLHTRACVCAGTAQSRY